MRRAEAYYDVLTASRRQRRAHTAPMAIGYQLLHLVEQLSLRAIVVADDVGLALAHAGDRNLSAMLADSGMWAGFASTSVDDMTLARIQQRYPDVELEHVASGSLGAGATTVLAVGTPATSRTAVRRALAGITRICAATTETGPVFLDPEDCTATPPSAPAPDREHGVRWAIGACR